MCGVCRTDLHVVEGELAPQRAEIVPGTKSWATSSRCGAGVAEWRHGDRVGIAWLHRSCGVCRFCRRGDENLCLAPRFTGWHVDGGFAEYGWRRAAFVYRDSRAARGARRRTAAVRRHHRPPRAAAFGGAARLAARALGFGASAHIAIQVARHQGCEVYVFSRAALHGELARELGATWVGGSDDAPPQPLDAAILFAPAGELVPVALARLDRGGTLAIAGIHLSEIPALDYERHLFQERVLTSVTANTREDGRALLQLAAEIPIRTHTTLYPLEQANEALDDLKNDRVRGAAVLEIAARAR